MKLHLQAPQALQFHPGRRRSACGRWWPADAEVWAEHPDTTTCGTCRHAADRLIYLGEQLALPARSGPVEPEMFGPIEE